MAPTPEEASVGPRLVAMLALALALALAGCTQPSTASAGSASPTPSAVPPATVPAVEIPEPPQAGACHRLTLAEAARPTSELPAVPCRGRHTTYTLHVGRLDTVVGGHSVAVDSDHVQRQLAGDCLPRLSFVGGTPEQRRLSRFEVVWFTPTLEQGDAGAAWVRCDVVALGNAERLMQLPGGPRLRKVLDRPGALETYGLCGTRRPGVRGFERVACGLRHSWVAISTITLGGGERYPGRSVVRKAGADTCADRVRQRDARALKFSYGWEWPTRAQWATGQHYGFCWAPSDLG
jgi:hypothetical protein